MKGFQSFDDQYSDSEEEDFTRIGFRAETSSPAPLTNKRKQFIGAVSASGGLEKEKTFPIQRSPQATPYQNFKVETQPVSIESKAYNRNPSPTSEIPVPLKSILKHKKHSLDDLEITTKKGLSNYTQSKQKENHHTAVHFS